MCGLCGCVGGRSEAENDDLSMSMQRCLQHRGPDQSGGWSDGKASLRHTRLAVIDTTVQGQQPMTSRNGRIVLSYNGELYNYRSIRGQLKGRGYIFETETDTEVLLKAFQEWGVDSIERLEGMFAFAVYDREEETLWLVRDRFGIKPLYYYWDHRHRRLLFASEVRALLKAESISRDLNRRAIPWYLAQQSAPTPESLIDGVRLIPPGHYVVWDIDQGTPEEVRYWHLLEAGKDQCRKTSSSSEEYIRRSLIESIEARLIGEVPLGVFLSGGIDSSLLVAIIRKELAQPVTTFTVALREDGGSRDAEFARLVAEGLNTRHRCVRLRTGQVLDTVRKAVSSQDHPSGDGINTFIVSGAASEAGLTVALSGLGADELFAGYDLFRRMGYLNRVRPLLEAIPESLRVRTSNIVRKAVPSVVGEKVGSIIGAGGSLVESYLIMRQLFSLRQIQELLDSAGTDCFHPYQKLLTAAQQEFPNYSHLAFLSFAESRSYMHDVLLRDTDQMGMAHSLEIRVPFLQHIFAEQVISAPDAVRHPTRPPKLFLSQLFQEFLPAEIARRSKQGFELPMDTWMRGPLQELCKDGLMRLAEHEMFSGAKVAGAWEAFLDGRKVVSWSRLWSLVCLGRWMQRENID